MDPDSVWANADILIGVDVTTHSLSFHEIVDPGWATFWTPDHHEILVIGIPPSTGIMDHGNVFALRGAGVSSGFHVFRFLGLP